MRDRDRYPGEYVVEHMDTGEVLVHHESDREMARLLRALPEEVRRRALVVGRMRRPGEPEWAGWGGLL